MLRRFTLLLPIICILFSATSYAGIHGILKGKVVDEDGKALPGATIVVEGAGRGANAKKDGTFQIMNLTSGQYYITAKYVGLENQKLSVIISADKTTEITVTMKAASKTGETVEIVAQKMVDKRTIGNMAIANTNELNSIAGGSINSFVNLVNNVTVSGDGIQIRGARATDSQIRVDGLDVGNQFTGGQGAASSQYFPQVSSFATEEVQVLTGGFGAEYGEATGGIVNSVVKTGRTDRYEGFLYYNTDVPSLFGSSTSGIKLERQGTTLNAIETGKGAQLQGKNLNNFEYGFGGPIPGTEKSTFYITGVNATEQYRGASYKVIDPWGNNLGQIDNTGSWKKNITARMKFAVTDDIDLTVGTQYGVTTLETGDWSWLYATDTGKLTDSKGQVTDNGIAENIAKQNVINQYIYNFFGKINHRLDETSFYELKLSYTSNSDESSRRVLGAKTSFFSGIEVMTPVDNVSAGTLGRIDNNTNQLIDYYEQYIGDNLYTSDGAFQKSVPLRNPFTGYYEGAANASGTRNAYGLENTFITHGNDNGGFNFRYGSYFQADGFYLKTIKDGDFSHEIKTGFEFRSYNQERNSNSTPYNTAVTDIYTNRFGGNLYGQDTLGILNPLTNKAKSPTRASVFVQDQINAKGLVFTPGLRFDYFNANSEYRLMSYDDDYKFYRLTDRQNFREASAKLMLSPRINVTYPVTENSNIVINYGLYYKMPILQALYDNTNTEDLRQLGLLIGNPNLDPEKTIMYNLSYNNQITSDFALNFSFYYNDIFNQLGAVYIPSVPTPYFKSAVAEYGSNKGLEIELRKVDTDHFGFRLNYTLGYINGTAADWAANTQVSTDPFTNKKAYPLSEFPLNRDIRHKVKYIFNLFTNNDDGPEIAGYRVLNNIRLNISGAFATGSPYTLTQPGGREIGERNALRYPSNFTSDLRFTKSFALKDIFGDGMKNSSIDFYVDVYNWLNIRQVLRIYSATGVPLNNGVFLARQIGGFTENSLYEKANLSIPETHNATQYDSFGERLYSKESDFDKNGVVTQDEKFRSYQNYVQDALNFRGNFQTPRTVYIGVYFRF